MFHPPFPVVPQKVKPQTVGGLIDLPNQVRPHPHPPRRVHQALEHRILHSLPLVFAHLRHPPQSPPPFLRLRTYVVCHHSQHHRVASLCHFHRNVGYPSRSPRTNRASSIAWMDRKSTRLNSSHLVISYAVFCLKKY